MTRQKAAQAIVENAISTMKRTSSNNVSISMLNYGMNADERFMTILQTEMPSWMFVEKEPFGSLRFRSLRIVASIN